MSTRQIGVVISLFLHLGLITLVQGFYDPPDLAESEELSYLPAISFAAIAAQKLPAPAEPVELSASQPTKKPVTQPVTQPGDPPPLPEVSAAPPVVAEDSFHPVEPSRKEPSRKIAQAKAMQEDTAQDRVADADVPNKSALEPEGLKKETADISQSMDESQDRLGERVQATHTVDNSRADLRASDEQLMPPEKRNDIVADLLRAIEAHKVYPSRARRLGVQGLVRVAFRLQNDGWIADVRVDASSGSSLLDEAAMNAVSAVGRVRTDEDSKGMRNRDLEVEIRFVLN